MSAVATNRLHGSTAATEILVLEPVAERLGLAPILLVPGDITIGSSPESQVQLTVSGVQPQHCVITCSRSRVSVRALDRRTWHNNLPLSEGRLRIGDRLAIGPVEFRVRQAEPWDVLPTSHEPAAADVARAVLQQPSPQDQAKSFESQLLRQIANLEAEVVRHQDAVTRLEQHATVVPEPDAVSIPDAAPSVTQDAAVRFDELVPQSEFTAPRFHLSPSFSVSTAHTEEQERLSAEIEARHREARQQLAELSVRNDILNRQCVELAAQWDQLRELIAEQEAATVERTQREQQLYERERRCTFQESEVAQRSQRLTEELDKVAARLQQLQTEADQLADQSALLKDREHSLTEFSQQLAVRESEIEQTRLSLEQREAACRDAEAAAQSWHQLREATEARWAQRAQEADAQAAMQQSQANELKCREQACEQLTAEVRHDRQQLAADRAHLAAEQVRLNTWNAELTQSQSVFTQQQQELAVEASTLKAEAQEFVLREYAWEQIVSTTQRDQERLTAEQDRLEALRSDFTARQSELTERQLELEARAADIESETEALTRRELALNRAVVAVRQDQDRLLAEQQRLEAWTVELNLRQSGLDEQQQELATQSSNWNSQIEELRERKHAWEQTVAATEQAEADLLAERYRLEAWHDELSAMQAGLTREQAEFEARRTEWEDTRRIEADATASALTNDCATLERLREECVLAERELEHVEADLNELEGNLHERAAELAMQAAILNEAQIECAWQLRESELKPSWLRSESSNLDGSNDVADVLTVLSDERDAVANELFLANQALETKTVHSDQAAVQLRQQSEQLTREVEACQQQWASLAIEREKLEASRQELSEQHLAWQTEQRHFENQLRTQQTRLAANQASFEADLAMLRSRESELATKWDELQSERTKLDQLANEVQQQQRALDQQARDLEQQQQELATRLADESEAAESQRANASAADHELAAAQVALTEQQERLKAAQLRFERERQAWEEDRRAWEEQLASETGPETSDLASTNVLDVLSRLDDLVQSELDHDAQLDLTNDDSDPFEAIRAQYGVSHSQFNEEELPEDDVPHEHHAHETPRSLWAADPQDENAPEGHAALDLPTTEEDLSVLSLRARLAEMFSLELAEGQTAATAEDLQSQLPDDAELEEPGYVDESIDDRILTESAQYQEPHRIAAPAEFAVEPVAEEYDSVESYMQRLLDRNRKSRTSEEPVTDRYISNSQSPTANESFQPAPTKPQSEFDDSEPEPSVEPDPVAEIVRVPTVRGPVDTLKMRAGLDSLRQVANISARHAIARSKWKKMRTRVALQSVLTGVAGFVGLSILTGKWLGLVGTNLWGWMALAIAAVLGSKAALDIRWIYQGERGPQRSVEASAGSMVKVRPGEELDEESLAS